MSENPDVCYIRELTEDEEKKIKLCKNGYLRTKEKLPLKVEKEFTVGKEMPFENLPSSARELCEGRRPLILNEKRPELQNSELADNKNQEKRACTTTYVKQTTKYRCKNRCRGWGRRRQCANICTNYVTDKRVEKC